MNCLFGDGCIVNYYGETITEGEGRERRLGDTSERTKIDEIIKCRVCPREARNQKIQECVRG